MNRIFMSKYIKRINWPWVEIEDCFNTTEVINVNEITTVCDNSSTIYKSGIRWKDGTWRDSYPKESLAELKDLLMNYQNTQNEIGSLYSIINPEVLNESQSLYEWLNENNQA